MKYLLLLPRSALAEDFTQACALGSRAHRGALRLVATWVRRAHSSVFLAQALLAATVNRSIFGAARFGR